MRLRVYVFILFFPFAGSAQSWSTNIYTNGLYLGRYGSSLSGDTNPYTIYTADGEAHDLVFFGSNQATLHLRLYDGDLRLGADASPNAVLYNNGSAFLNGNVGIGTSSPYSWSRLHAKSLGPNPWGIITEANSSDKVIALGHDGSNGVIATSYLSTGGWSPLQFRTQNTSRMTITEWGDVGIGRDDPSHRLSIRGSIGDSNAGTVVLDATGASASLRFGVNSNYSWIQAHGSSPLRINELGNNTLFNSQGGNVGIGTTSPDSKLSVKGTIHTQEVKVDLNGSVAPDYVFEEDYPLTSLEELKSYIQQNKHLPEVPSAKEMEEEGINLKEMNLLLLKKIEELTLHVIQQRDDLQRERDLNKEQSWELDLVKKRLAELQNQK